MRTTILSVLIFFVAIANADVATNRTYKDTTDYIHKLAQQYPKTTQLFTLGYSNAGVAIEGIKIGNGAVHNLLVATHHGNEYGSTEVALNFAESLAKNPISGQTMYVIPVLNIDGYDNRNRYEKVNGQYIDLNRDYPGPCGTEGPHASNTTKVMADFLAKENIVASSTLHTYWPAAVYPWGISSHDLDTPYTPTFLKMVQTATEFSHYQIGDNTEVIYPADGTFEDYAYWKYGVWSILFEMGDTHTPDIPDLNKLVSDNVQGLRNMYANAPKTRAEKHDFTGKCDTSMRLLDLHIE